MRGKCWVLGVLEWGEYAVAFVRAAAEIAKIAAAGMQTEILGYTNYLPQNAA
ncbi:MAG: hypothetical protein PHG69_06430 [Candidatus Omnitrophica bacterium]|nr:hypothetical protein [Candidatus Omnitrophota bacterium]